MSKKVICNPLNLSYKYQFVEKLSPVFENGAIAGTKSEGVIAFREAADPSMILFKGKYYLFPSMSKGFWVSDDLADWRFHPLVNMPVYDYAPDVCAAGEYLYFCASDRDEPCTFYRTKDPESGVFETVSATFDFWDPDLFLNDDGKMYFYWGCTNKEPIWGVELDPVTLHKKGDRVPVIHGDKERHGFERVGYDHVRAPLPEGASEFERALYEHFGDAPFIEGAWMTKHNGRYYLQYAAPGTEFNIYGDGVYLSDRPLSGFRYAENNPYSYKPGGFMTGAGHGSTMQDNLGAWWHVSTMQISASHSYERRIGLFPAGFDGDGELFCNQRYGDWPLDIEAARLDPWAEPEWMLLSYGKQVRASSEEAAHPAALVTDEDARSWWRASKKDKTAWIEVDLGDVCRVNAVQLDFADEVEDAAFPEGAERIRKNFEIRYIDGRKHHLRWLLEGSADGKNYAAICDKRGAATDLPHDLVLTNVSARYIRCTVYEMPLAQPAALSGLRIFGKGQGDPPRPASLRRAARIGGLDAEIAWEGNAVGYVVLWGHSPEKLYHSCMVFGKNVYRIGAFNAGQRTWVRVDSFNENGIAHGKVQEIIEEKKRSF